jgi:hypothetical protein
MSQHDHVIADQDGASFLADLNSMAAAIVSLNAGATAPTTTYSYMWWPDTANDLLKQRNAANSAWIEVCKLSTWALLSVQKLTATLATITGTGTAIVATQSPATSGVKVVDCVIVTGNGGAATTMAVNGDAAKDVKAYDSTGTKVNTTLVADQRCVFMLDGDDDWILINPLPPAASSGPAFSAYLFATQSLTSGSFTQIQINTEEFDTDNAFSTSTYRFTPQKAGYYQINGVVSVGTTATQVIAAIYKNGVQHKRGTNATSSYASTVSSEVYLNGSTDYVDLRGLVGSTQNADTGAEYTYFNGTFIRS